MTLSTDILILAPVMPDKVWGFVTRELLQRPDYASRDETKDGRIERWGVPGQGADAWAIMKWIPDAPIAATRWIDAEEDEEDPHIPPEDVYETVAVGSVLLDFDTAYGYRTAGAGCSDLHAAYILLLFKEFGPLWWHNEFTGEWFLMSEGDSVEQMKSLSELGDPVVGAGAIKVEVA